MKQKTNFAGLVKRVTCLICGICFCFGIYAQQQKPFVIPELKEWKGATGFFMPKQSVRIIYGAPGLQKIARQFAADYKALFGVLPEIAEGKPCKGDFFFTIKRDKKLEKEGYDIVIGDYVKVSANEPVGVYWATRTLLQMGEQYKNGNLPKGHIRDWPDYGIRGLLIDCGRKFIPMNYLRDLACIMSYYKMNFMHVVLNNNGFKAYFNDDWNQTYAAFRLECETYPGLTARDGYYTKKEFVHFQEEAAERFVEIIPEIDIPAHSLAFSHYKPELGSKEYGMDHLNLSHPEVYSFVDALFKEYLDGENPVFRGPRVHIGTDEYSNKKKEVVEQFRAFTDHYIKFVEGFGKQACVWGALTHAAGETPVKSDNVIMYAWYNGFANPKDMVQQGYNLISIPDGLTYIVPLAGYYWDYLNTERLYKQWTPAHVADVVFEEKDPAIIGGMFAVWNDIVGNGISVKDIHHRIFPALQTIAVKTWNIAPAFSYTEFETKRQKLSEAPDVNQLGRIGDDENSLVYETSSITPGSELPYTEIGYDYTITFDMEAANENYGTELFRSPNAVFYLADPVKGMFGFSRDGYMNTFAFRPYPGEKISVKITGDALSTSLFINGQLIERMGIEKRYLNEAEKQNNFIRTLVFPLKNAGNFKSKITNLKVYNRLCSHGTRAKTDRH
ncbi:beta-N-acetylhexosaminidase [Odoribacter splanchnicus]|nr:family 20 glycosylhydrolase [Odoribacter splanchnicus]MBQ7842594.1 family 20 glycosylhydrolase [Odoribacter sp.]MDB9202256.1 family 20 glycosylhydrolase [Odoribacter splanchnicus]NUN83872.1 family 20 glycosylhydrolase [Odoribacter splanchnicus]RHL86926.1 beta-N-acetylhexosaminidase [Odoribacter splanchnicus]HCU26475.1 beta-N-acetylhexosaminidase [Odoribacter splanchnicus]